MQDININNNKALKNIEYISTSEVLEKMHPLNSDEIKYNIDNIAPVNMDISAEKIESTDRSKAIDEILSLIKENNNLDEFGFDKSKIKTSLLRYMLKYPEENFELFGKKIGSTKLEVINENGKVDFEYNSRKNVICFKKSCFENVNKDSIYCQMMLDVFYNGGIKEEHFETINMGARENLANSVIGNRTIGLEDDLSFQYKYVQYISKVIDINDIINAYKTDDCLDLSMQIINKDLHNINEYAAYAMVRNDKVTEQDVLSDLIKNLVSKGIDISDYLIEGVVPFNIEEYSVDHSAEMENNKFSVDMLGDFGTNHSEKSR